MAAAVETVVFIDCPDPDNYVLAVCAALIRGARHVVLTGRPANFEVRRFRPLRMGSSFSSSTGRALYPPPPPRR